MSLGLIPTPTGLPQYLPLAPSWAGSSAPRPCPAGGKCPSCACAPGACNGGQSHYLPLCLCQDACPPCRGLGPVSQRRQPSPHTASMECLGAGAPGEVRASSSPAPSSCRGSARPAGPPQAGERPWGSHVTSEHGGQNNPFLYPLSVGQIKEKESLHGVLLHL